MRQYKYILFKDGKPWKGLYSELDFINEYDHAYAELCDQYREMGYDEEFEEEHVIPEFFRRFGPAVFDHCKGCFCSLLRDLIIGNRDNEGSVVIGIDWEDLSRRNQAIFAYCEVEFKDFLSNLTNEEKYALPEFGVSRGSGYLRRM